MRYISLRLACMVSLIISAKRVQVFLEIICYNAIIKRLSERAAFDFVYWSVAFQYCGPIERGMELDYLSIVELNLLIFYKFWDMIKPKTEGYPDGKIKSSRLLLWGSIVNIV